MNFEEIKSKYNWIPIRNCPGRFVLRTDDRNMTSNDIAGSEIEFREFQVEKAKDIVLIGRGNDFGLISYRKDDGSYLHTLKSLEGFERKINQLGIVLTLTPKS